MDGMLCNVTRPCHVLHNGVDREGMCESAFDMPGELKWNKLHMIALSEKSESTVGDL